jgi:hypothetical protein
MATYTLIEKKTAVNNTTAAYVFTSIPQTYTDLCLKVSARNNENNYGGYQIWINGQSSNNSYQQFRGYGSTVGAASRTDMIDIANLTTLGDPSGYFSGDEFYLPNYTLTSNLKSVLVDSCRITNDNNYSIRMSCGVQAATAAITSISITLDTDHFLSGSTFYLYGIKNS